MPSRTTPTVPGAVSRESASTTLVRIALNCGPRGSISLGSLRGILLVS